MIATAPTTAPTTAPAADQQQPRHALAAQAVAQARLWLGTPWVHQARVRGVGVDCVGLLVGISRTLGVLPPGFDVIGYGRQPDGASLMHHLRQHLAEVPLFDLAPGDFLCVAFDQHPQHVGVVGDYLHGGHSIIHAINGRGVVETRLLLGSGMRFVAGFALPPAAPYAAGVA